MGDIDIADVAKYVRELWVDRLQSTEELTVENNLSLEEALQLRNEALEGCVKDLEVQTDALLLALEEADSILASPRHADERLQRRLALGECLRRIGRQEAEAESAYDREKVEFLRQARQLLIDSFSGDSPVISESSLVDDAAKAATAADANGAPLEETFVFPEVPKVTTEEQDMQTEEAVRGDAATQTKALAAKKNKALKKQTDELAPKILRRNKDASKSPKRDASKSPKRDASKTPKRDASKTSKRDASKSPKRSPRRPSPGASSKKPKSSRDELLTPQYISARLRIRAPSPRRRRLPWESAAEGEGTELPPQPCNSAASLAEPSDDNMGFETAEEAATDQQNREKRETQNKRKASKSPKRVKGATKSKSPKRAEQAADGGTQRHPEAPPATGLDMGQGEGSRPRRRRSKTQRSQMKSTGAAAAGSSDEEESGARRRRRSAEPHGDGGRPALARRRSPRTAGDGSPARPEKRGAASARGARAKQALSPPAASQVYCLTTMPQPTDLTADAAAVQSDSKLLQIEADLGAKRSAVQPRPTRRKRCSGGGDTMSVHSFNSAEDGRGRGAQDPRSPRPARAAVEPQGEPGPLGATGGEAAAPPANLQWETGHAVSHPDPFSAAVSASPTDERGAWLYRMQQREEGRDVPPADGTQRPLPAGDDSGFQSEAPPRSPAVGSLYVPPLPLPLSTASDASEAASPQPRPKSDTEIAGLSSPRSPRSPSRGGAGATSPVRHLERSFSCEVPAKKQRCAEESVTGVVSMPAGLGSGDQSAAEGSRQSALKSPRTPQSPPAAADTATSQEGTPSLPASPSTGHTPQPATAADPASPVDPAATPVTSSGPVSPASPPTTHQPAARGSASGLLRRDYDQLRTALAELKQLQTSFQRDFSANEQAREASSRLQSDIQRMETSIQELQGIVSQEYEQTRQDHEETRAAIGQIEARVAEGERAAEEQVAELRARLELIDTKMARLEGDVSREKKSLPDADAAAGSGTAAPTDVQTLSSMLSRLETEVITLRHEVDSNRHSLDSITSVTQLDSPKPSPGGGSGLQASSAWQESGRTEGSGPPASAAGDAERRPRPAGERGERGQTEQRPDELDSFKDSASDLMSTAEEGPDDCRPQQTGSTQQPGSQQQAAAQQGDDAQTEESEQRRPEAISPLKMSGGRRSLSCCRRHRPEVLRQLRQLHLAPPVAGRSRSAAPPGTREGSEYDSPLQEYWAADLSTASASTEAPRVNESTRVHHGSSRRASGRSEERRHRTEAFFAKLDGTPDPSAKLDRLQHKLLALRRRVLRSMYRRQRRRAVSEGPSAYRRHQHEDPQQLRRRAQLEAIDRRLRQRVRGWDRRMVAEVSSSLSPPGDAVSDSSEGARRSSDDSGGAPGHVAGRYLDQLSRMLARGAAERDDRHKARAASRGRHRERAPSPPTQDPSSAARRGNHASRRRRPAAEANPPGVHIERFARNESKLVELQEYLGGIRQHLQRMAAELDSPPPSGPGARGARGLPATHAVVFRPWTRRHRSVSSQRPMVTLRY